MAIGRLLVMIERALDHLATFFLVVCIVAVLSQVIMRYVFNNPTPWSDPLASDSLAWLTFLGAAAAVRRDDNIAVTFTWNWLTPGGRRVIACVCQILIMVASAILLYSGIQLTVASIGTTVEGLPLEISWAHVYSVTVVSAVLMILFSLHRALLFFAGNK